MFPAPTTIAIWTPRSWISLISSAIRSISWRSTPYSCFPINASPDSFNSTRRKTGAAPFESAGKGVAHEVDHLGAPLLERHSDGLAAVVDPLLVDEHGLSVEALGEHALDDLLAHLLRLRLHRVRPLVDRLLGLQLLRRDLVSSPVAGIRERDVHRDEPRKLDRAAAQLHEHADLVRRRVDVSADRLVAFLVEARGSANGDVLADLPDELDPLVLEPLNGVGPVALDGLEHLLGEGEELLVLRHRLGLGADGHERAMPAVEPREDGAFGRLTAGALARRGHPALTQERLGGLDIAGRLLERAFAIHHSGSRLLTELLDEVRRDLGRAHWDSPSSAGAAAGASISAGSVSGGPVSAVSVSAALSACPIGSCSTGVSSAAGSGAASSSGWPFRSKSSTVAPVWPDAIASLIARTMRLHERIASSLPGITRSASSGSQFVSTSPMIGSPSRLASFTAICSLRRSITNSASGWRLRSATPPRLASSFSSSASIVRRSFAGSRSS